MLVIPPNKLAILADLSALNFLRLDGDSVQRHGLPTTKKVPKIVFRDAETPGERSRRVSCVRFLLFGVF